MSARTKPVAGVVFWDVDRTLMFAGGIGASVRDVVLDALVPGHGPPLGSTQVAGRTDVSILTEMLAQHGIEPTPEVLGRALAVLAEAYQGFLPRLRELAVPMAGAAEALAALARLPGVVQTLLTGNLQAVARWKIEAAGLDAGLRLDLGGYGDVSADRADLVPVALASVREAFDLDAAPPAVVVGDTVHDVAAALAHGLPCIGVEARAEARDAMSAAGAAVVLDSLAPAARMVDAVRETLGLERIPQEEG